MAARRAAIAASCAAAAIVGCGAAANAVAIRVLSARYPPPGRLVDVDGRPMHIYCSGAGSPMVLLESGAGDDWIYWQKVQPEVAAHARVCAYDRAGLGWSDAQPGPRDAPHVIDQLHRLLGAAGERPPLVLVGASAGALYVRVYASTYPSDVAGLVFVDGSTPEQAYALPAARYTEAAAAARHRAAALEWIKNATGWSRATGGCAGEVDAGLERYADVARVVACRPSIVLADLREWEQFWRSAAAAREARCCGRLPIVIVSQDPDRATPGWSAAAIEAQPIWNGLQDGMKSLSPNSRRVIARGSGHHVMVDRPDVVVRAILDVVDAARAQGAATK
jgi:pimeloyl-ACP methyl ester carboxylesterase